VADERGADARAHEYGHGLTGEWNYRWHFGNCSPLPAKAGSQSPHAGQSGAQGQHVVERGAQASAAGDASMC